MNHQLLLVAGKPGSGKTTAANMACETLRDAGLEAVHLSIGNQMRGIAAGEIPSVHTERAKDEIEALRLHKPVSHDFVTDIFEEFVEGSSFTVVDGYPRYIDRIPAFRRTVESLGAKVLVVCRINVPDTLAAERLFGRSQRFINTPEDKEFICNRLNDYREYEAPTIERLGSEYGLCDIDGALPAREVASRIVEAYYSAGNQN